MVSFDIKKDDGDPLPLILAATTTVLHRFSDLGLIPPDIDLRPLLLRKRWLSVHTPRYAIVPAVLHGCEGSDPDRFVVLRLGTHARSHAGTARSTRSTTARRTC